MIEQLIILIFLLIMSAFFSASETALFSISRAKARHLAKSEHKSLQLIHRMKQNPHKLLSTVLVGNVLVNIGASALATSMALDFFPNHAVGLTTGIMTFVILVFGEVFPKSLATRNNILISKMVIYPIYWMTILFYPIILMLNFIPKLTGKIQKTPTVTEAELLTFVEVVEEEGEINEEEVEMIHNIFELDDTSASEIMTPRADMFVIHADHPLDLESILQSGYSRIPVIEDDMDHVVGVVNIKDLFIHFAASGAASGKDIDVRKVMNSPYFVPENIKLDTLLHQFKVRKNHIAIVIDEHGGVAGLITLEDALEELVGEIIDESDKEEPFIQPAGENEWIVLGKTEIEEVNDFFQIDIPDTEEYDTFSGYIMNITDRIPNEMDEIIIGPYLIIAKEKEGNRINKYIVRKMEAAPDPEESPDDAGEVPASS
jgi:putative hemolysin